MQDLLKINSLNIWLIMLENLKNKPKEIKLKGLVKIIIRKKDKKIFKIIWINNITAYVLERIKIEGALANLN